jgi:hypothetical protein
MSSKDQLPLLIKHDCLSEYDNIKLCIKINSQKINKCDVQILNLASDNKTRRMYSQKNEKRRN